MPVKVALSATTAAVALLSAMFLSSCASPGRIDHLDRQAPPSIADQTIIIGPETTYVNVKLDDTVTFVVGDKSFTTKFDDPTFWPVDLSRVAPPGVLTRPVLAYVSPFRRYFGRDINDDD